MFKSLQPRSLTLVVVLAILAFFPSLVSADAINPDDVNIIETPSSVLVTLNHALQAPLPSTTTLKTIESKLGFWAVTLTVVQSNQTVHITGDIRHLMSPPGHPVGGFGPKFNLDLTVTLEDLKPIKLTDVMRCCDPMHDVDFDRYTATLTGTRRLPPNASNFASFELEIVGVHTPEPATIILLGTGLAGVAIKTRKRLRNRERERNQ